MRHSIIVYLSWMKSYRSIEFTAQAVDVRRIELTTPILVHMRIPTNLFC